ncbi:MAG: hypothetical protein IKF78_13015 [Atopobiaceae bacterium]|nr:hypothetical protein [Atopobiaceae bacterium]
MFAHVRHKLQSQRGASLSMALMLFLVCAVVASISLAAATAAAGRQSQLEAVDKSYYNVTSAAKLLSDELKSGSQVVTITRECDATKKADGSFEGFTNWKGSIDSFSTESAGNLTKDNATLFQLLAYDMVFAPSSENYTFSATRTFTGDNVSGSIDTSTLETKVRTLKDATYDGVTVSADGYADVLIKVERNASGGLVLRFGEKNTATPPDFIAGSYKCKLTATADIHDINESGPSKKQISGNTYHLTWTTKIYWDTQNLQLGGS